MEATALSLAETVTGGVLKKVATSAVDKMAKMLGVRKEVRYIRRELEMMQAFLVAAEARDDNNNVMLIWVRQVRDLAYGIEDCLAEFSLHLENRSFFYRIRTLRTRHRIASSIRDIRERAQEVSDRKPLNTSSDASSSYVNFATRMDALLIEETELVGHTKSKYELIEKITERNEHLKVIWVTGMGGLGKTTLARKVVDSREVRNNLPRPVWVTVSQNFNPKGLLSDILKQISENTDEKTRKSMDELLLCVRSKLEKNAYLVVLDDLWTTEAWKIIKNAFPDNGKGSRVMVTTRNTNVAERCDWNSTEIYPVEPLSDESSRHLLLRKIYKSDDFSERHRSYLDDVTNKIIRKCGGLPLAIVTIGGLLATKPINKEEWEKLLTRLGSELETNPNVEQAKQILDLSYHDLPCYLKPCLLYLSIFPEDFEINCNQLVYRWIAEGFVGEKRGMTPEEVAEEYFYELINRNLIQPSRAGGDGTIKTCRVHDIMHELLVTKSIEENLIFITGEQENMTPIDNIRHLVITRSNEMMRITNLQSIRSISIFNADVPSILSSHSKLKLLRVFELQYLGYIENDHAMRHLGQFEHLKYISLPRGCSVEILKSLGNLRDLQTLLMECGGTVPNTITKLRKLRYFDSGYSFGVRMPKGIGKLKELQVLKWVNVETSHPRVVEEIAQLRQLRELRVAGLKRGQYEKFSASISQLSFLRSLRIEIAESAAGFLDSVSSPPEHLRSIKLHGQIEKLPAWVSSRYNLAKVTLLNSRLKDDAIFVLQELPNLLYLQLGFYSYVGTKLSFKSATFPKLRVLDVSLLQNLEELHFEEGTLQTLRVEHCELKSGISGIERLRRLKILELGDTVYVANLDEVRKQLEEHPNCPALEFRDPKYQKEREDSYRGATSSGGLSVEEDYSISGDTEEMENS